jgi:putative heme-binding domain-containing protein
MTQRRVIFTRSTCSASNIGAALVWVGLLTELLVAGYGQAPSRTQNAARTKSPAAGEGQRIFEATCAGCHGLDGRGGERGPDISTRQQVVQLSDLETLEVLRRGVSTAGMPPFGALGTTKLNVLLAYLRSLQGKSAAAAFPGDPQEGKALFFGKARCSECHMIRGEGGFLGRDLTSYGTALSPKEIRENIVSPGEGIGQSNKTAMVALRDSQILSGIIRNEDNFSVQLQSFDGGFHLLMKPDVEKLDFLPDPIMPVDYGHSLTPAEMDDLVKYLVIAAKGSKRSARRNWEDETE